MTSSDFRRALFRGAIWPAAERLGGRSFLGVQRELEEFQWLSPAEVERLQWERIGAVVRHAYATVPYYHHLLDEAGVGGALLATAGAAGPAGTAAGPFDRDLFARIPVTRRRDLKEQFPHGMVSRPGGSDEPPPGFPSSLRVIQTAGTTGTPAKLYQDPTLDDYGVASAAMFSRWSGLEPGDRGVYFQLPRSPIGRRQQLLDYLNGRIYCPMEPVLARDGAAIARLLERVRPDAVCGYPSLLRLAALALRESGRHLSFKPRATIYYSEAMDRDTQTLVGKVFEAPVFSRYGAMEFTPLLAQTCPERVAGGGAADENLHLNAACVYVEIAGEDGRPLPPGVEGRILITDLRNRVMPFIRYEVGDTGALGSGPCGCGRGLPLLASLRGRASEFLVLPSGRRVPALNLQRQMRVQSELLWEYQFEQPAPGRLVASVVPLAPSYGAAEAASLRGELRNLLGEPLEVEVRVVPLIPREPSGKRPILKTRFSAVGERPGPPNQGQHGQ